MTERTYRFRAWRGLADLRHVLWLDDAMRRETFTWTSLAEDISTDVLVVGGGYTGLWTATHIKRQSPGTDVCVLEADLSGSGASGRNGGFAVGWWTKLGTLVRAFGRDDGLALARLVTASVPYLEATFQRQGVDIQYRAGGWLWTATDATQLDAWAATVRATEEAGVAPFAVLSRTEVEARTGSHAHLGGVLDRSGATIHPGLLVRALRRLAIDAGVRIYERSPVTQITTSNRATVLTSAGNRVNAERVVLAANAWMAHLAPVSRQTVVVSSDMIATTPVPGTLDRIGWTGGEGISNSAQMLNYFIRTQDGRVALGRGGATLAFGARIGRSFDRSPHEASLRRDLARLIPALTRWNGRCRGFRTLGNLAGMSESSSPSATRAAALLSPSQSVRCWPR
jgi:glycine/D-amino acid oxidase-like deaminating enzyme